MKQVNYVISVLIVLALAIAFFTGCENDVTPSLYDPDKQSAPDPVITTIDPPDSSLAGITILNITGENFSSNPDQNFVYFDDVLVDVISASETQIVVKTPNIIGDSIAIKIAVHGAELFSNIVYYILEYTAKEYGGVDHNSDAYGLACDPEGNVYVSYGSTNRIVKIDKDEEQTDYVTGTPGFFNAMKWGPGGTLYACRTRFMYKIPPGGGAVERFEQRVEEKVNDFDFDPNGNIFVAGKNGIYCVKPDGSNFSSANYESITLNSIRVYDGYVYVAGNYFGTETDVVKSGIWRNQIIDNEGALGDNELVFDWGQFVGEFGPGLLAIAIDENGNIYAGADAGNAITIISTDGSTEALYPEVLTPQSTVFCWDNSNYLYVNRKGAEDDDNRLVRVTTATKSAPYYGRQ